MDLDGLLPPAQARIFGASADRFLLWATDRLGAYAYTPLVLLCGLVWHVQLPWSLAHDVRMCQHCIVTILLLGGLISGWGQWDAIREHILTDPLFRFDYYTKTRTSHDLRRRVEQLTRALEKELSKPLNKERAKRRKAEEAEEASFLVKQRALLPRNKRKGGNSNPKGGKKRRTR